MTRRHSWLPLAGACLLFTACAPAEQPEDSRGPETEEATVEAAHTKPSCVCRPPVLMEDLAPGDDSAYIKAMVEFDGGFLVSLDRGAEGFSLLRVTERKDGSCDDPAWDVTLLRGGFTYYPYAYPLATSLTIGRTLYFTGDDGVHGNELWKTDGTPEGTKMVEDIAPGSASSFPGGFVAMEGRLYFNADDGTHGRELWTSDGTRGGTRLVADVAPGPAHSNPEPVTTLGSHKLLFYADDGLHGREPWVTTGTKSGTRLIEDINPGPDGSEPFFPVKLDSHTVLFTARDEAHGREPWVSDGTPGGTRLVEDIHPGPVGSDSGGFVEVGCTFYFSADDGVHGTELWRTDGTPGGTRLVEDLRPGPKGSLPSNLSPLDGRLFFFANDGVHGHEPWVSNGKARGTRSLGDLNPGPDASARVGFAVPADGKVFFLATTPSTGLELWVSDGSVSGTHLVKDINPGPEGAFPSDPSHPYYVYAVGSGLVFAAYEPTHGNELWWTDGTEEGTHLADLVPGDGSSEPSTFLRVGRWVYISARDEAYGPALWALPTACFAKAGGSR